LAEGRYSGHLDDESRCDAETAREGRTTERERERERDREEERAAPTAPAGVSASVRFNEGR